MANGKGRLRADEYKRFTSSPVKCQILRQRIGSLSDYFSTIAVLITGAQKYWFRGHAKMNWSLTPSALRYKLEADRKRALQLVSEFKRVAEIKLPRPPGSEDDLKWVQLAQHYGIPTRLLDWTESATIGLYFACLGESAEPSDGMVFMLNPVDLNRLSYPQKPRVLDAGEDTRLIQEYLRLDAKQRKRGKGTVAVNPVWNSERLMLQKGVFTLHGSHFDLDSDQASSLVALPIFHESKVQLLKELERVGVDEMSIFPEIEHSCRFLVRKEGLYQENS